MQVFRQEDRDMAMTIVLCATNVQPNTNNEIGVWL